MPSEPVAKVVKTRSHLWDVEFLGLRVPIGFGFESDADLLALHLNAALAPLVEAGRELKEVHVALGGHEESEMRYGHTVELAKQAIAKAYEDGRKAGLEEAAKAICGHCAEGLVVWVTDGRAQHETHAGREECAAYPVRALKEPKQ
jgi:hypothetical protein